MQRLTRRAFTVVAVVGLTAVIAAHEVTYRGTVAGFETARYAQPGGGVREVPELEITVLDARTKKPSKWVFVIADTTRLLRAGKPVTLADAAMRPGERVEVMVDHDEPGDVAIEVRLLDLK
jgi:hypothetical protein